jgi:hypothetical protein
MKDYVIMQTYKTNGILGSMKYIIIMLLSMLGGDSILTAQAAFDENNI